MRYRFSNFVLDSASRLLLQDGRTVELPRRAFDCLLYMLEHRERAIGRDELALQVWGRDNVSDNQIAQTIAAIRRVIGDNDTGNRLLRTVPAFGYHWTGPVVAEDQRDEAAVAPPASQLDEDARIADALEPTQNTRRSNSPAADIPTTSLPRHRSIWPLSLLLVFLAASIVVLGSHRWMASRSTAAEQDADAGTVAESSPVWVLPAILPEEPEYAWARVAVMALIGERLRRHGIAVVPIENVLTRIGEDAQVEDDPRSLLLETGAEIVVQARIHHDRDGWRVAIAAKRREDDTIIVHGSDRDLIGATEPAADALAIRLGGQDRRPVSEREQRFELIRQAVQVGDFDGARAQLARLPMPQRDSIDAGLIETQIDIEKSQLKRARERIDALLERARSDDDETALVQVLLARISLARKARQPEWHADVDWVMELAERGSNGRNLARASTLRGIRELEAGRYDTAVQDFSRARRIWIDQGDELGAADAIANLGRVSPLLGNASEALDRLSRSARVYRRYGAVVSEFVAAQSMTTIQIAMLRWDDALASSDRARLLLPHIDDPIRRGSFKRRRASVLTGLGRLQEAAALLDEAERELRAAEIGEQMLMMEGVYRVQILLHTGDVETALKVAESAFAAHHAWRAARMHESAHAIQAPDYALWTWMQARAAVHESRPDLGEIALTDDHLIAIERAVSPYALIARGDWLLETGQTTGAEQAYRQALAAAELSNSLSRIRVATTALVSFLLPAGRIDEAQDLVDTLYARDPETLDRDYATACLILSLRHAQGDWSAWREALTHAEDLAAERTIPAPLRDPPQRLEPAQGGRD